MSYVTGNTIKKLREKNQITQKELAEIIKVSDKTVSKWETNKGLPDVGIIEDLAKALRVSVSELLTGDLKINENISGNMKKVQFYVCPICGNIILSVGEGNFSCCGITLPKQESESMDESHLVLVETIDDEYSITMAHPIEHFCILPEMRNKQYGQKALALLAKQGKTLILEIDPPKDDISKRRKGFYERCGFTENLFTHIHPSYHKENGGHHLVIMKYCECVVYLEQAYRQSPILWTS